MVRVKSGSAQELTWPAWPADQFSAKGAISGDLPSAKPWRPCRAAFPKDGTNPNARVAVKRSLPHSPKLHTKRQRQLSILHFLDVLASGNSYRATRPHGTEP